VLETMTVRRLRELAVGMPYRGEATKAELIAWLREYGSDEDPCANCGRHLPDHDRNELAACQAEHDEHLGVTR